MKSFQLSILQLAALLLLGSYAFSGPRTGFYLPDSIREMTLRYRCMNNLIVLPVVINDSIHVNLILDTGCRNLVLFGRKFQKLLPLTAARPVQFSGLGSGKPVQGQLSLGNKVSIHRVLGEKIPIVVVPERNIFGRYHDIHGVIGYEIFLRFEIQLNPLQKTITFRPGASADVPDGFARVPMKVTDCRPLMDASIQLGKNADHHYDLMIDTGSSLGLLLKTTTIDEFDPGDTQVIGIGLNGNIVGYNLVSHRLQLDGFAIDQLKAGIIESPWHNYASIGMEILKDYVVILNYCKSYACFRKATEV
jgi:hypothetical protein